MTEKRYTEKEVGEILAEVISRYIDYFIAGKMTFGEFAIIENLVIEIQNQFKELEK